MIFVKPRRIGAFRAVGLLALALAAVSAAGRPAGRSLREAVCPSGMTAPRRLSRRRAPRQRPHRGHGLRRAGRRADRAQRVHALGRGAGRPGHEPGSHQGPAARAPSPLQGRLQAGRRADEKNPGPLHRVVCPAGRPVHRYQGRRSGRGVRLRARTGPRDRRQPGRVHGRRNGVRSGGVCLAPGRHPFHPPIGIASRRAVLRAPLRKPASPRRSRHRSERPCSRRPRSRARRAQLSRRGQGRRGLRRRAGRKGHAVCRYGSRSSHGRSDRARARLGRGRGRRRSPDRRGGRDELRRVRQGALSRARSRSGPPRAGWMPSGAAPSGICSTNTSATTGPCSPVWTSTSAAAAATA